MTLFLIGLVVVLSAGLLTDMAVMRRRNMTGEQTVNGLLAFERIRGEVLEAITIEGPIAGGAATDTLIFTKIDPGASLRLSPGLRPFDRWSPADPAQMIRVTYGLVGRDMVRTIAPVRTSTGSTQTVVARNIDAFSVSHPRTEMLELKISFTRGKILDSYTTKVRRYLP